MSENDALDAETLQAALGGQRIGHRVIVLAETVSTNDVIAQMAAQNPEGLVVFAERQTAGRGQYGRSWESAAHRGLWLSVLLRPNIAVGDSGRLTNLLARVIATTVEERTGLAASIKPPNDVFIGPRKVAGVLVEMRVEADGNYAAIAGIGINVNQTLEDFSPELRDGAGSIAMASGHSVDRGKLAVALLRNLDERYERFRQEQSIQAGPVSD
jgi:BirA family biotin operon repressor/biotin-[acetyl-CoA-carboxylase] ligase